MLATSRPPTQKALHWKKGNCVGIIDEPCFCTWHYLREAPGVSLPPSLPFLFCRWPSWPSRSRAKKKKKSLTLLKVTINMLASDITFVYTCPWSKTKTRFSLKLFPLFFWFTYAFFPISCFTYCNYTATGSLCNW